MKLTTVVASTRARRCTPLASAGETAYPLPSWLAFLVLRFEGGNAGQNLNLHLGVYVCVPCGVFSARWPIFSASGALFSGRSRRIPGAAEFECARVAESCAAQAPTRSSARRLRGCLHSIGKARNGKFTSSDRRSRCTQCHLKSALSKTFMPKWH